MTLYRKADLPKFCAKVPENTGLYRAGTEKQDDLPKIGEDAQNLGSAIDRIAANTAAQWIAERW